jgi:hypothetical protein
MVGFVFSNSGFKSFIAGFFGVGVVWLALPFYIEYITQSGLADKIGQLFPVNIFAITSLVGALVGGFASMTGSLLKPAK